MVYKFVRIDLSEPCKVTVPVGKHIIGRGKFLVDNTDDNKVSRNHAELDVTTDSVTVKSLHINPCFYIKKSTEETQVLSQNNTITLSNGDKFGILPQIYWYELIYCPEENKQHDDDNMKHVENRTEEQVEISGNMDKPDEQVETCIDMDIIKTENVSINFDAEKTAENGDSQESISLLTNQSPTQDYNFNSPQSDPILDQGGSTRTPVKRPHDSQEPGQNDEPKKARAESDDGDTEAGPSKEQKVSPKNEVKDEPSKSPGGQPPTVQLRERCMYGANCYRKNGQHKAQFSHPQDSDWDDNRRQCQFGAGCRRRDPRHWRDYLHPPGVNPPNPNRPGMQVVERNGNIFYINAHTVNFYEDRFQVEDSDGDSVDYDYEF